MSSHGDVEAPRAGPLAGVYPSLALPAGDDFVLKMSQTARRLMRAALALCILAWLGYSVGFGNVLDELEHASMPMLLAATALLALDGVAKARNWQQLLIASVDGEAIAAAAPRDALAFRRWLRRRRGAIVGQHRCLSSLDGRERSARPRARPAQPRSLP